MAVAPGINNFLDINRPSFLDISNRQNQFASTMKETRFVDIDLNDTQCSSLDASDSRKPHHMYDYAQQLEQLRLSSRLKKSFSTLRDQMDYLQWLGVRAWHDNAIYSRSGGKHAMLAADNFIADHKKILELVTECSQRLEEQFVVVENTNSHMMKHIDPEWRWWAKVNTLHPATTEQVQRRLDLDPPTEARIWSETCHLNLHTTLDSFEAQEEHSNHVSQRSILSDRVLKECNRIADMKDPDGPRLALDLLITLKTEVLHSSVASTSEPWFDKLLQRSDLALANLLKRVRDANVHSRPSDMIIWLDAVGQCARLHSVAGECACSDGSPTAIGTPPPSHPRCYYKDIAEALEMLQKHAYSELRPSVILALGRKLPRELVDLVVEWAFLVAGIPVDPVIFRPTLEAGDGYVAGEIRGVVMCGDNKVVVKRWSEKLKKPRQVCQR